MNEHETVAFIMMTLTSGVVVIALLIAYYAARKLRSREIVTALEHGRDLPEHKRRRARFGDLRSGILLVAFAVGFGLFLWLVGAGEGTAVFLIPLFLGIGFLINAAMDRRLENADGGDLEPGAGPNRAAASSDRPTSPEPADPAGG